MFLVIYEDYGKEPQNVATAETVTAAKAAIAHALGIDEEDVDQIEREIDEQGRQCFIIGDAQYVIVPLVHWR